MFLKQVRVLEDDFLVVLLIGCGFKSYYDRTIASSRLRTVNFCYLNIFACFRRVLGCNQLVHFIYIFF
ncbi:hypothetical protein QVD17_01829 [Tagetes erecta]|uniref:Uncharacterized protein n=1 Tax=Tagetes erecta TaxID=13708 RepID=A0AAD8P897_TARER|nr:hypothetical protein QVD17_01829 [Tagetes erecta]